MRSPTNPQHSSVASYFKSIDFVVYCFWISPSFTSLGLWYHWEHVTHQNSDSAFHADVTLQNGSLSPESNLRFGYSLWHFCLTLSCMLYCCSQVFVWLDLCKPLSFYIHFTLFLGCFIYDHCFCLLGIHCHTLLYHAWESRCGLWIKQTLPMHHDEFLGCDVLAPILHYLADVSSLVRGCLRIHAIFFYLPLLSLVCRPNASVIW